MDTVKAFVNYSRAFDVQYGLSILDAHTKSIVEDRHLLDYLPSHYHTTKVRYVRSTKLILNNSKLFSDI